MTTHLTSSAQTVSASGRETTMHRRLNGLLSRSAVVLAVAGAAALTVGCNPNAAAGNAISTASAAPAEVVQNSTIGKHLAQRLPGLPAVVEVRSTPMSGLYEVRLEGNEIIYSDAKGDFLLHGTLLDTRSRVDLTAARQNQLDAIAPEQLPLQDAITVTRGKGKRQIVVFADPRCPYCHKLEAELAKMDNITVHTFVLPVLGAASVELAQQIWCSSNRSQAWQDWMLRQKKPTAASTCDTSALERTMAFARQHRINGTPALFFADGSRVSGFIGAQDMEEKLKTAAGARR